MPIRPFHPPHTLGVDICHIPRIVRLLAKPQDTAFIWHPSSAWTALNWRFVQKVLRPEEMPAFRNICRISWNNNRKRVFQYFAGRFAAKEAIIKASSRKITLRDIIVLNSTTGAPYGAILSTDQPAISVDDYLKQHFHQDVQELSEGPVAGRMATSLSRMESSTKASSCDGSTLVTDDSASQLTSMSTNGNFFVRGRTNSKEIAALEALMPEDELMAMLDGESVIIAISHEDEYAVASAMSTPGFEP